MYLHFDSSPQSHWVVLGWPCSIIETLARNTMAYMHVPALQPRLTPPITYLALVSILKTPTSNALTHLHIAAFQLMVVKGSLNLSPENMSGKIYKYPADLSLVFHQYRFLYNPLFKPQRHNLPQSLRNRLWTISSNITTSCYNVKNVIEWGQPMALSIRTKEALLIGIDEAWREQPSTHVISPTTQVPSGTSL